MDKIIEAIRDMRQCRTANENLLELIKAYAASESAKAVEEWRKEDVDRFSDGIGERDAAIAAKDAEIERLKAVIDKLSVKVHHLDRVSLGEQSENKRLREGIATVLEKAASWEFFEKYANHFIVVEGFKDQLRPCMDFDNWQAALRAIGVPKTPSEGEVKTENSNQKDMSDKPKIEATPLCALSSSPAPKEWVDLPAIAKAKPSSPYGDDSLVSLQQLDGLPICIWMRKESHLWNPASDYFAVLPPSEET